MEDKKFLFRLGQKIRILRAMKNYSQEYLAELVSIDKGYLSNIECGRANPTIIYLMHIAKALDCTLEDLLKFEI